MAFEKAAHLRDQISSLRQIFQQQAVISSQPINCDVIALAAEHGVICVQISNIRDGRLLGSKAYFPAIPEASTAEEVLAAFLPQYYLVANDNREIPKQIFLSHALPEKQWIATALSEHAKHTVNLINNPRGERARWLQIAQQNAQHALIHHLAKRSTNTQRLLNLQHVLQLKKMPQRLECFDISHSQGEATVASCVVFDEQGPKKSDYRKFNIEGITKSDDYAAIHQALQRHFMRLKTIDIEKLPDVLIIDGGKGQLKQAEEVIDELQIPNIIILAIAKGPGRKAGLETIFMSGKSVPLDIEPDSPAMHLLQHIRDEAHRFAITAHRGRRAKSRHTSVLEQIPGIGSKRRRELLRQFGGLQELKRASVEELSKLPGINKELAQRIHDTLQKM